MLAALNNHASIVELLVQYGADRTMADINGRKAEDLAAAQGHEDVACLLSGKKPSKGVFRWP